MDITQWVFHAKFKKKPKPLGWENSSNPIRRPRCHPTGLKKTTPARSSYLLRAEPEELHTLSLIRGTLVKFQIGAERPWCIGDSIVQTTATEVMGNTGSTMSQTVTIQTSSNSDDDYEVNYPRAWTSIVQKLLLSILLSSWPILLQGQYTS